VLAGDPCRLICRVREVKGPGARLVGGRAGACAVFVLVSIFAVTLGAPSIARADVGLPPNAGPYFLTIGSDGAIWFTEHDAGQIGRLRADSQLSEFPLSATYSTPYDIVSGSDGALWFSDPVNNQIDRASTDGQISEFDVQNDPAGLTEGPDGAVWFAYNGSQPGIGRLGTDGTLRSDFIWPDTAWITDVAFGSDGNLWMTEGQGETCAGCYRDKIGRLDGIDGTYSSWILPTQPAYPFRIVNGPDNALWFTEPTANKIGRITTAGQITEYPLPGTLSGPRGITVGADSALWFTAGSAVGRITASGAITAYPVPGADSLLGIALGPDNAFWLADQAGNHIIRFVPPPSLPVPPKNACSPVRGSVGKRLLASLKCTAAETVLEAKCAFGIVSIIGLPARALKAVKTVNGLYDLRKIKKSLRPIAKLINDLKTVKFGKHAPRGFKTGAEVIKKLENAHRAWDIVKMLPDLAKALSGADYRKVALDIADLAGLKPCIDGMELAVS
jgi:virginiamycin B lyase